jgi:flagellar protein FlaJ
MKFTKIHWIGIIFGVIIILVSSLFLLKSNTNLFLFLSGIGLLVIVMPFIVNLTLESKNEEEINSMFLEFSRNLAESVNMGTPVSKSIVNMSNKNYGALSPYIKKLANQIELGIPLHNALTNFADDVDSTVIRRAVALIMEAERAGGQIDYILESVATSISEIEKIKKERKSAIYSLVVQGYIIFFVFIGIMLIMQFKILPLTTGLSGIGNVNINSLTSSGVSDAVKAPSVSIESISNQFLYLLLAQGFFAGLIIGKLGEGSIKAGLKHSFILLIASFLIATGARAMFG